MTPSNETKNVSPLFIWILIGLFSYVGIAQDKDSTSSKEDTQRFPKDLVMIHHGNEDRPVWNKENLEPYVFRNNGNQVDWLFDGFLFLELDMIDEGGIFDFRIGQPARKKHWKKLIDNTFASGDGPDGLEAVMEELANQGHKPPHKIKVVLSVPNPVYGQSDWGSVDGKSLDFYRVDEREKAVKWYIDKLLEKWEEKNYQHLKLSGLYWLRETIKHNSGELAQKISGYIHQKDLDFYWVPFYGAGQVKRWHDMGFDIAYQQPNHYTDPETSGDRLMRRVDYAKKNGLALHMEFDERVTLDEKFLQKYYDYIDEFDKQNIWYNIPVVYDEGDGTWLKMSESEDTEVQEAFQKLSDLLVERKEKEIKPD